MKDYYHELLRGADDYIDIQPERNGLIPVAQSESSVTRLQVQSVEDVSRTDCSGGRTNISIALQSAFELMS
jgi:hypothetical protein